MKKIILGLLALASVSCASYVVKTECVEGYKFLVVEDKMLGGVSIIQIYERLGYNHPQPIKCEGKSNG